MLNGHGDDSYRYIRRIRSNFSSNVYVQTDLSGLKAYVGCQLDAIASYPHPEAEPLRGMIAARNGVLPEHVCVTNGAVEGIYLIAQVFRGKRSGILVPTFSEYADACHVHGHEVTFLHALDAPGRFDLVWLCNPNNPTGKVYDKDLLTECICRFPEVVFIIDQAYESFTVKPVFSAEEIMALPNVILLRSLTKAFAIPGLRLGYIVAQQKIVDRVCCQRMPWSVNSMAIAAGHYLLAQGQQPDMGRYLAEKDRLSEALCAIADLEVLPSDVHFMLVCLRRGRAVDLKDFLANEYGILIRDASNFQGLNDSYIRIATQTPAENDRLVQAIRDWFTKKPLQTSPKGRIVPL